MGSPPDENAAGQVPAGGFPASHALMLVAHAHADFVLRDLPHIFIKGPTMPWLFDPGERLSVDVDVLVPPRVFESASAILDRAGFVRRDVSDRPQERAHHSRTFVRARQPEWELDLHDRIPGITLDA